MSNIHMPVFARAAYRFVSIIASVFLAAIFFASPQGHPASNDNGPEGSKQIPEKSDKAVKSNDDKKIKTNDVPSKEPVKKSTLRIVVTGSGRPIERAEVRVTPVSQAGESVERITRLTDHLGLVEFSALDIGPIEIVVIARGDWQTRREPLTLKEEKHLLNLDLVPW